MTGGTDSRIRFSKMYFQLSKIFQTSSYYELMRLGQSVTRVEDLHVWSWMIFAAGDKDDVTDDDSLHHVVVCRKRLLS